MSANQPTSTILFDAALDYAIASSDMSLRSRKAFVAGAEWQWARVSDSAVEIERLTAENNELRTGEYLVKVIEERDRIKDLLSRVASPEFSKSWLPVDQWRACRAAIDGGNNA